METGWPSRLSGLFGSGGTGGQRGACSGTALSQNRLPSPELGVGTKRVEIQGHQSQHREDPMSHSDNHVQVQRPFFYRFPRSETRIFFGMVTGTVFLVSASLGVDQA